MHDRKVYVLGICALLSLPANHRPEAVAIFAPQFLPALIHVFDGLNGLYDSKSYDRAFFNCYLAALRSTLGHYRQESLTHRMLISAF